MIIGWIFSQKNNRNDEFCAVNFGFPFINWPLVQSSDKMLIERTTKFLTRVKSFSVCIVKIDVRVKLKLKKKE